MRQKAVSIAPQNEAPIQIAPIAATTPIVVELSRIRSTTLVSELLLGGGKDPLQVADHAVAHVGVLDHLAEDEQDQEREREQRQRQVVGDHRREPGDVLAVGALPEDAQEPRRSGVRDRARRPPRRSTSLRVPPQGLDRLAEQPDADGRGLGRRRDPGPGDVLEPAARLGLVGRRLRRTWRPASGAASRTAAASRRLRAPPSASPSRPSASRPSRRPCAGLRGRVATRAAPAGPRVRAGCRTRCPAASRARARLGRTDGRSSRCIPSRLAARALRFAVTASGYRC